MDTGSDFIKPEFLNIIFFQQKNLVIFPYVDLKHLHALEKFTVGYNVIDLETTALHNLKEILEFESTNSYSQTPTLYFIYNVDKEKVKEIMELDGIRCVINSNENISNLANGSKFIFYNKKNNQFLNYNLTDDELEFENLLISSSQDEIILQENIQKIKIVATRIFKELNQSNTLDNLYDILKEYDKRYWNSILDFTSRYYDINIPEISEIKFEPRKNLKDFSREYEVLISTNHALGKEFIQLLHEYRSRKVNPAHLELDELYNPQKLYNYLRNHHWKEGIPNEFIDEWHQMNISNYKLSESDQIDIETIEKKLGLVTNNPNMNISDVKLEDIEDKISEPEIPLPKKDWIAYKIWLKAHLDYLEQLSQSVNNSSKEFSYFFNEISELYDLLDSDKNYEISKDSQEDENIPEKIKEEIMAGMPKMRIGDWVELYEVENKRDFIVDFFRQFSNFYDKVFRIGDSKDIRMPTKIKKFQFPLKLERELFWFNNIRNKIAHSKMTREQITIALKNHETRINSTFLHFLAYLIQTQVYFLAKSYNYSNNSKIKDILMKKYLKNPKFTQQDIKIICNYLD
ncbi:MAG: hypothetical protein ACFFAV_01935 [Candidatus Hermodarchaeota archaeon]